MTGDVLERSATGILVLLIPLAFALVVLYSIWPLLLLVIVTGIALRVWQKYRWQQWSKQVTPYFNQLVSDNQGCLTPFDLAMRADLTADAAQRFLDRKAAEYGAQCKDYKGGGRVYYFLTASALGTMFKDSEPVGDRDSEALSDEEMEELVPPPVQRPPQPLPTANFPFRAIAEAAAPPASEEVVPTTIEEPEEAVPTATPASLPAESQSSTPASTSPGKPPQALIQAELAKRLAVHSGTLTKRKSDPDFPQWTQSRDPEGIAWKYAPRKKVFLPVDSL